MAQIEWADPPSSAIQGSRRRNWDEIAAALREHPGKSAKVATSASAAAAAQLASGIRGGKRGCWKPEGSFAAAHDAKTCDVFAWYIAAE